MASPGRIGHGGSLGVQSAQAPVQTEPDSSLMRPARHGRRPPQGPYPNGPITKTPVSRKTPSVLADDMRYPRWKYQLFVDGSAKNGRSGWAVAIVLHNTAATKELFAGLFGAPIQGDRDAIGFYEQSGDSFLAEQTGIIWSMLWILQMVRGHGMPHTGILYDNKKAGKGTDGCSAVAANSALARKARGIKIFLEKAGILVEMGHVKSHQQHPWNELVDVAAKINAGVLPSGLAHWLQKLS